jgi:hypothetical protein
MKNRNKEVLSENHSITVRWPIVWKFAMDNGPLVGKRMAKKSQKDELRDPVYRKSRLQTVSIFSNRNVDSKLLNMKLNSKNTTIRNERRIFNTPSFKLCGSEWSLTLSPILDNDDEFLAVHLVSQSNNELFAAYNITIKSQIPGNEDLTWIDPEGVVQFSSVQDGDNEWGCDDLISIDELDSEQSEFLSDGHIHLEIQLEVHRDEPIRYESPIDEIVSNQERSSEIATDGVVSIAGGLKNVSLDQAELMALAKDDISSVLKKLSKGRDSDEQKMQEDRIIRARLLPTTK